MIIPLAPGRAVCAAMAAAALLAPAAATAQETRQTSRTGGGPHVRVELIASQAALGPGMWLGLRFDLDPDWHIYWRNPGDSGGPPEATWVLPPGLQVAEFEWPAPSRFEVGGLINYGYHGSVVLPVAMIAAGVLVYNGAIDDKPTSDRADLAGATNYVSAALGEGMAGKALTVPTSRPYGCGVKYAR